MRVYGRRRMLLYEAYLMKRVTLEQERDTDDVSQSTDFPLATGEMGRQPLSQQGGQPTEILPTAESVIGAG